MVLYYKISKTVKAKKLTSGHEDSTNRIAYIFAGSARSFVCPKVHWSIKAHLIDALGGEPYVFIYLSNEDNQNMKTGSGIKWNPVYEEGEIEETLRILNPVTVKWFSLSNQIEEMKRLYPSSVHTIFRENDQRRYSMFFHRCRAYKLVLHYEEQRAVKFDWVILVRLDAAWLEPVLPISAYSNDRVWITETGYDIFNDQFMLIPRQYSDYIYDLNTKVDKDVYCLGGPDVESWKCNATELYKKQSIGQNDPLAIKQQLEHCCSKEDERNGESEFIHYKHLRKGKIPVSIARFPVFLTRRTKDKKCLMECFRIYAMNYKEHVFRLQNIIYPYLKPAVWPDTRSVGISARDRVLCYYMTEDKIFPWQPIAAKQLAQHDRSASSTSSTFLPLFNNSSHSVIDYRYRLVDQPAGIVHPSILLKAKDTEVWRIHPTWNIEGCLTYSFKQTTSRLSNSGNNKNAAAVKQLHWEACNDHARRKRTRYDSRQLFFLTVIPPPPQPPPLASVAVAAAVSPVVISSYYHNRNHFPLTTTSQTSSNNNDGVTRVIILDSTAEVWDYTGKVMCLTVADIKLNAAVYLQQCSTGGSNSINNHFASTQAPSSHQLFLNVHTLMDGSHPASSIGQLQLAANPTLCVGRSGNRPRNTTQEKIELHKQPIYPNNNFLSLLRCSDSKRNSNANTNKEVEYEDNLHRIMFEFELIGS